MSRRRRLAGALGLGLALTLAAVPTAPARAAPSPAKAAPSPAAPTSAAPTSAAPTSATSGRPSATSNPTAAATAANAAGPATSTAAGPTPAAASATPPAVAPSSRCDGLWGVDRLSLDQRRLLYGVCLGGTVDGARLHVVIRHLLGSDLWHAGALAWLVNPGTPLRITWAAGQDPGRPPAIDGLQRSLDDRVRRFAAGGVCPAIRGSKAMTELITAADEDREPDDLPFDVDFLDCVGVGSDAAEGSRLLTVRADGLESLVVAFATPSYAIVRRYGRADMITIDKHRFVVLAVPEGTPLTLIGESVGHEMPLLWRSLVGRNQAVWMTPVRYTCVDLDVRLDAGDRLFVDGREIAGGDGDARIVEHALNLARDLPTASIPDHQASVIRCADPTQCEIRYLARFAATVERPDPRNVCHAFRLDLHKRERQQVAILAANRSESCARSGLRVNAIRDRVRFILTTEPRHSKHREVADVGVYAQVAAALSTLSSEIDRAAGGATGPETGVESSAALGTVAKEAWRQGLDVLMNLELQCQPKSDDDESWTYTISGTMIQVDEIFKRGYYGGEGLNLENFIRSDAVTFGEAELEESAIALLLDRLFQAPSSRFIHGREEIRYREPLPLRIGAHSPEAVPESHGIRYKRIPRRRRYAADDTNLDAWRPKICDQLSYAGRGDPTTRSAAVKLMAKLPGKATVESVGRSRRGDDQSVARESAIYRKDLRVRAPGWYLVATDNGDWGKDDKPPDDVFCLDATHPERELWIESTIAAGPMVQTATDVDTVTTRARIGYARYLVPILGVGVRGGYVFTDSYLDEGQVSWQDLSHSSGPLRWRRHGLQLGPLVEVRSRWTKLPFELRGRLSPFIDVGIIGLRDIPPELAEFRTTANRSSVLDVDVGVDLDLLLSYAVGPITIQGGTFITAQAIDDDVLRTGVTVKESFAGIFGFLLGIGVNPR